MSIYQLISYIITKIKMSAFRKLFSKGVVTGIFGTTAVVFGYVSFQSDNNLAQSSELKQEEKAISSIIENTINKLQIPPIVEEHKQTSNNSHQVIDKIEQKPKEQSLEAPINEKKQEQNPVCQVKMGSFPFKKMSQIIQLNLDEKFVQGNNVLIVADLPFTTDFEAKVINQINRLQTVFKDLQVFRKDIHVEKVKQQLSKEYKAKIEDQTIFLLKNSNEKELRHFNFDMFMQYPLLLQVFLTKTMKFQEDQINALKKRVANLRFNQSCLLYIYDKDEPAQKLKERLTTAKYIQMQLVVNNLHNVRILAVEKNAALKSGLVSQQNIRTNSIHLFRKHNIFTPFEPNFKLITEQQQVQPFFRLADIALYESGSSRLMIPAYLSGLQTFDSQEIATPYICSLRIDRNKISQEEYHNILRVFGEIKKENKFPEVAFHLKFKQVPYPGKGRVKNSDWQISIANMEEIQKESMMHQITQPSQLKLLGFKEETFQKERPEYLYEHGVLNKNLLEEFLLKSKKGELKKYYKSQPKPIASNIKKVTGDGFEKQVLQNGKDNIVYEYSDFCPTCKNISPIISHLAQLVESRGLGLENVQFNRLQANKNRIRNYLYSPYIPNIYYFKRQWKNSPARFPIQFLAAKGVGSIYEFFRINKQIETISWDCVDKAVGSMQQFEKQLSSL